MVINKHGSFYMRDGWVTKIIEAIDEDRGIFTPSNEQAAIDNIGLGRIMIKALRYWAVALGLTTEVKTSKSIEQEPTKLYELIRKYDRYAQKSGTLLMLHRHLVNSLDEATAWYWFFNEKKDAVITRDEFVDGFHSYLSVNGMKVNKAAVEKEFNCLRSTYITDKQISLKTIMDEDTVSFFSVAKLLESTPDGYKKTAVSISDLSVELLIYAISEDNPEQRDAKGQLSVERLLEEKGQVGRYFNIQYTELIDGLLLAENKGYIKLNNNFGNRFIEFVDIDYQSLLERYYAERK